jgi:hypothetical protein
MKPPATDEEAAKLAGWIVSRGFDYYAQVLDDMTRAPQRRPDGSPVDLCAIAASVYRQRFGRDVRDGST